MLESLARTRLRRRDPLTGLPDRAQLHRELSRRLAQGARTGDRVVVVFVDLDDFKLVNEALGHAAGDEVLRRVAAAMQRRTRRSDLLGRLGGDEFVAVAWEPANDLAARLVAAASAPVVVAGVELRVGASAGSATAPAPDTDAWELVHFADQAMLEAKAGGRNRVVSHHPGRPARDEPARDRIALTASIPRALERDELILHWQPIVDLRSGAVAAVEALVRWQHPERGLLLPGQWIPFAESTGLIGAVDRWVAGAVAEQRVRWRREGLRPQTCFNLSPSVARQPGALDDLLARLAPDGLGTDRVTVELTESAAFREDHRLAAFIRGLRAAGIAVALDDFGKAYSSLSRLRDHPVRSVKIDRTFLRGVPEDPAATQVLDAVLQLVQALALDHVVEGVETEAQRAWLERRGAGLCQGYLLGRPVPAEALEPALRAAPTGRFARVAAGEEPVGLRRTETGTRST